MEQRKVVLVTGASNGIGRGIAVELAKQGYDIAFSYRKDEEGARKTCAEVEKNGAKCRYYRASMEKLEEPVQFVESAYADFGRVDAIICNAAFDRRFSILNIKADEIEYMMRQLYAAQILAAGAAARHMVKDGIQGSIVFISSIHGQMSISSDFLYGGMKAALERSSRSIALELSPYRIRVNCIAPGAINVRDWDDTDSCYPALVPFGRRGMPEEIGAVAAFLLSEGAAYITGETIRVDGGMALPGQPECWAEPHPVDMNFVKKAYDQMMKNGEENEHV